jgi:hypothetical protein
MPSPGDKKIDETDVLNAFRNCYTEWPGGLLNPAESPDFILSLGPRNKIGIELVRLHLRPGRKDPFSYENLSECIEMKEDKLRLYRKRRLREYWLIIAVRDPAYQPAYNLKNKILKWSFHTSFHRVFLFNVAGSEIMEFNLAS